MKRYGVLALVFLVFGLISASNVAGGEAEPSVATEKSAAYTRTDDIIYGRK